jgi:hypothetical protein
MTPNERLEKILIAAEKNLTRRETLHPDNVERVEFICRCMGNRAPVRVLLTCLLAKLDNPNIDPRKPYVEIGTPDCFSGRNGYDEQYLTSFIHRHRLPCNPTTAFLTPGFRNLNRPLTTDHAPVGRPKEAYTKLYLLLEAIATGAESAKAVLTDTLRVLVELRNARLDQLASLQSSLQAVVGVIPLSAEAVVTLIRQHLACRGSSRLPVLLFAAAYDTVGPLLGESRRPLHAHNAADEQTGAIGDVEVVVQSEEHVRTAYEMKQKRVTADDIDRAIQKIAQAPQRIDNYLFVTTDPIDPVVEEYAHGQYAKTGGTEIAIVDCLGFVRHFLHLFHRHRRTFLDAYQALVLAEPDSAVSVPLKSAFLSLRQAAESEA